MRALLAFLAAIVLGSAALAQAGRLRVVGVASNDVLNIREFPSVEARVLGFIPPDGRGVESLDDRRNGWMLVRWQNVEGWAAGEHLIQDLAPPRRGRVLGEGTTRESWWAVLGSFGDPRGAQAAAAITLDRAARCGFVAAAVPSNALATFTPGLLVVVVGPFFERSDAEGAAGRARPCTGDAYVKYSPTG